MLIPIDTIEAEIAASKHALKFSTEIERAYHDETAADRLCYMRRASATAILLYNLFLVNDWLSIPDRFGTMLVARLCLFSIPALLAIMLINKSLRVAERTTILVGTLAVALPMGVMLFSTSPHKLSYQYGTILVMMFVTIIQRLSFAPAALATVLMLAVQLITTFVSRAFDTPSYVMITTFFVSAAILQLVAVYFMDVSDRRTFLLGLRGRVLHEQLQASARTDILTGLFNRHYLAEVSKSIASSDVGCVSAILLDVDHFKLFNDNYGHLEGDKCLQAIGGAVREVVERGSGYAFRFGGEEMLVLLPDVAQDGAIALADAIRQAIASRAIPHPALGAARVVSASLGVACIRNLAIGIQELIAEADAALYAAKRCGRDCVWPPVAARSVTLQHA